jgi:hypothetical protein
MAELLLHTRPVRTVFDLLGDKEDDITYSFGWALANSERLAPTLLSSCFSTVQTGEEDEVTALRLQETMPGAGRTDVEVETKRAHLILEAKRGWNLPTVEQLEQYATRFDDSRASCLLVVAECTTAWAKPRLPEAVAESNMVYVVSLGIDELFGSGMSFADIVVNHDRYFHPVGGGPGGWPKTPPNYVGFRFHGKLQQVRHVEDYDVHEQPWETIPGLAGRPDWPTGPHFLYKLGPVMAPNEDVRTGKLYRAQRVWAALDLLLTSPTIAEARDETNKRLEAAGKAL